MEQKKIGRFIAELRKENKMTQEKLADLLFVDRTTISKWEVGDNNISTEFLLKISKIFNVTINEIMIGERQSINNINEINSVTVNILQKNKRIKKYLIYSCSFIIILLLIFLSYYFINNYNSIKIYEIHGENETFTIHNGLMMVSKDKTYIQLGSIKSLNNIDIASIKLYYEKDKQNINLYEANDVSCFFNSTYDDAKLKYNDIKYLISNLILEVRFDNGEISKMKLNLIKTYSNNKIYNKNMTFLEQEVINSLDDNIPLYIKKKFNFDENNHSYYLEESQNNKKIKYTYFYDMNVYIVEEIYNDYSESYTYSYPDDISYIRNNNSGEIQEEFVYSIVNRKCIMGECNDKIINYFNNQYLYMLKSN